MRISDWSSDVCSSDLLQYLADRLDPVQIPVLIEIGVYFFSSRSSAAWAKKALADFRISLARRNSRFSFSNALRRSRSRSEERRGGKECVITGRSRWSPEHKKKKTKKRLRYTI